MDKSTALKYKSAFVELYSENENFRDQTRYIGLGFLIGLGSYLQKRKLLKKGAPEWAAYGVPLITAGLARVTLEDQLERMEFNYQRRREFEAAREAAARAKEASEERHEKAWGSNDW